MGIFISASMLEDFISCNKRVYYRINHPELSIQSRDMIIGEIVHLTIEKAWQDEAKALDFLHKELEKRMPDDYSAIKFSDDCLQTFFHVFRTFVSNEDKIEKRFKVQYDADTFIVGKLDRISNGLVFDWKTSRKPPTDISGSIQFILYNWAYQRLFDSQPKGVYYASLVNGSMIKYKHDPVAHRVLFSDVIPQIVSAIKHHDYTPNGVFRKACYWCQYSDTCLKELSNELGSPTFVTK